MRIAQSWMVVAASLLVGCSSEPPAAPVAPVRVPVSEQLVRAVPPLRDQSFSTILDFESENDSVFVIANPTPRIVPEQAHTGRGGLRIPRGCDTLSVKLGSVLAGREFPDDWTLIGGFFFCTQQVDVMISVEGLGREVSPRVVTVSPSRWTLVLADLGTTSDADASTPTTAPSAARLVFRFSPATSDVWCDDVLLIDNRQAMTQQPATQPAEHWTISKRGLKYVGEMSEGFAFELPTIEAQSDGWKLEEANDVRARFSSDGSTKALTIYSDGRAYWDGRFRPLRSDLPGAPALSAEHDSPAQMQVPEELGRLDRQTPGDANNDGYNEVRGAYEVLTSGARLELQLTPRSPELFEPVLEIRGFPPGKVLVTMEGRLVERTVRLDDGSLLVQLPGRITRSVTINVRLQ
ncbi:MAG: hypothetical protein ACREJC_09840 [Tepidisphaeraceae bacterium]